MVADVGLVVVVDSGVACEVPAAVEGFAAAVKDADVEFLGAARLSHF